MDIIFLILIVICLLMSLKIFLSIRSKHQFLARETILVLVFMYISLLVSFAMFYLIFMQTGSSILLDNGVPVTGSYFQKLNTCLYFSAVTLFSVGYGDINPVGIGRFIAVIQALIGYLLPIIFVARSVISSE
ncbi:two pore domain potassium channel family protein [Metabacillus arenae]|uniref:Two pore domain potassium channel family protein n=1 Tax=Metabacillus arenae TaxID=2771434 RepID=A0A926NKU8_9BACI|nr:two pore domain potassium channel family protein [Metabacillus arenae]MBD1379671.1 two pore domain potassium channel family protein [Metabacillus arenae]